MADETGNGNGVLACVFPNCGSAVQEEAAWVPALDVLRKASGKEPRTREDLVSHVLCARHAAEGRREGLKLYRLPGTLAELARRQARREEGRRFFSLYSRLESAERPATLAHRER